MSQLVNHSHPLVEQDLRPSTEQMSRERQEEFPRWPPLFAERRQFSREAENETYIEFLQTPWFSGEEHEEDEEEEEEEDDDDDEEEDEEEEEEEDENDEEEVSSEQGNKVEGDKNNKRNKDQNPNDDKGAKACSGPSKVRLFMRGLSGEEDNLHYLDQVEEVASICEQANLEDTMTKTGQDGKHVALLDDRNIRGTILVNKGPSPPGDCRPYLGPLTAQRLGEELSRKRLRIASEQNTSTNAFEDGESDAERRVIFITDLDPSTIEVLVTTASRTQAPALKDLFYKHLMRKTAIGVTIPPQGFAIFSLDFHIPYYVLRVGEALLKDTRKKSDGKPLRESWELPFLSPSTSTKGLYCLYEAQISVAITGIDHWVWTAYGFADTYFDSEETVDAYDQMKGRRCRRWGRADPLAAGRIVVDEPIWMPREYFLRVFEIRMNKVLGEWNCIGDKVEKDVKQSRTDHIFPLSSDNPKTRQQVRDFIRWNNQMVKLLRQLISGLSDTVDVWDQFSRKEIGYFRCQSDPPTASSPLKSSIAAIENAFWKLKVLRGKLHNLREELCAENPQGLNAHLSLENNEAAVFQQEAAKHVQVLTVLTIVFFPLVLAASLFSTTGVLPFKPNLAYFIYVIFILAAVVVATVVVLFNWRSWLQVMIILVEYVRNATKYCGERPGGEEIRHDASILQRASKWGLVHRRNREADVVERLDLESGLGR